VVISTYLETESSLWTLENETVMIYIFAERQVQVYSDSGHSSIHLRALNDMFARPPVRDSVL
jgi:hypothetical protein